MLSETVLSVNPQCSNTNRGPHSRLKRQDKPDHCFQLCYQANKTHIPPVWSREGKGGCFLAERTPVFRGCINHLRKLKSPRFSSNTRLVITRCIVSWLAWRPSSPHAAVSLVFGTRRACSRSPRRNIKEIVTDFRPAAKPDTVFHIRSR